MSFWGLVLGVLFSSISDENWINFGSLSGCFGTNLKDFGGPKQIQSGKVQYSKILCFPICFLTIFEIRGLWKSITMGSRGYQNRCEMAHGPKTCILEAKNAVLGAILASQNLPKWNYGGLQGPRGSLTLGQGDTKRIILFGFGLPKID